MTTTTAAPTACIETTSSIGSVHLTYEVTQEVFPTNDQIEGLINTIQDRIDACGLQGATIQRLGGNLVVIQLSAIYDVTGVKQLIGETAHLEFKVRTCLDDGCFQFEDDDAELSGADIDRAYPAQHSTIGSPVVNIYFNTRATQAFADITRQLAEDHSKKLAVFLDGELIFAPVVARPIVDGAMFIEGPRFTTGSVKVLAVQLRSGPLPVPIALVEQGAEETVVVTRSDAPQADRPLSAPLPPVLEQPVNSWCCARQLRSSPGFRVARGR